MPDNSAVYLNDQGYPIDSPPPVGSVPPTMPSAPSSSASAPTSPQTPTYLDDNGNEVGQPQQQSPSTGESIARGVSQGLPGTLGQIVRIAEDPGSALHEFTAPLKGIWDSLPPSELAQTVKRSLPLINAYEKARSSGATIQDSLKAAGTVAQSQERANNTVLQAVKAFKENPSQESAKLLTQSAALAASFFAGGPEIADTDVAADTTVAPEAAASETASPTSTAVEASPTSAEPVEQPTTSVFQKGKELFQQITNRTGQTAEQVATENAAKAPISAGSEAVTADEAPTVESVQPEVDEAIREKVNATAVKDGLGPIPADVTGKDLFHALGDEYQALAKSQYSAIKSATGVDLNELDGQIADIKEKIGNAVGEPDKIESLQEQLAAKQGARDTAAVQAEKANLDPDAPSQNWKKYKASYDIGSRVRASADGDLIDPNKLAPRLDKAMNNKFPGQPGRLQQVIGDDNADDLFQKISEQRGAIKNFQPSTATGQQAMKQILTNNTGKTLNSGVQQTFGFAPKTNYIGALRDFGKLTPEEITAKFPGEDAAAARSFLQKQATWQVGKMLAKGGTVALIAQQLGVSSALIHAAIGGAE